jgi:hypothetical protein
MGSDQIERNRVNGSQKGAAKRKTELGCFVGLNPTEPQKKLASALWLAPSELNDLLEVSAQYGLVINIRWDERNAAFMATLTKKADNWEDNQTIGAFHVMPLKALALVLIMYRDHYAGLNDWRSATRQVAYDW